MHEFIVADTETGGLFPHLHALLSIGAVCSWDASLSYEAYITVESQPGKIVAQQAAEKNGYTPEKWKTLQARPLAVVITEFLTWLDARKKERAAPIVCHHLAFDKAFLGEAARVARLEMPHRNDWRCSQAKLGELMDLGIIKRGSSSLDRLRELSAYEPARHDQHNALQDCQITAHGYRWLHAKAKTAENTVKHLYDIACQERRAHERLICEVADYFTAISSWEEAARIGRLVTEAAAKIREEGRTDG